MEDKGMMLWGNEGESTFSVSQYVEQLNRVLATQAGRVRGEVTSISPSAKAVFFTLKDPEDAAQLPCLMWLSNYRINGVDLKVGDEVIVTGMPDFYAPYGRLSFKADTVEYAGEGPLKQAYDKLKAKLETEGLFTPERKRQLPEFPKRIGVITSMHGVVIQDFTSNLGRHGFRVRTIDARVEGKDAIHDILAAIKAMSKQPIDVLVIMRGGGSWESLQPFNTESVVRAIAGFKVPVLTGIGHDVDVTLAEMAADVGLSTPTAVAKRLNESWDGLEESLALLKTRILSALRSSAELRRREVQARNYSIIRSYERGLALARSRVNSAADNTRQTFFSLSDRVNEAHFGILRAAGIMRTSINSKSQRLRQHPRRLKHQYGSYVGAAKLSLANSSHKILKAQAETIRGMAKTVDVLGLTVDLHNPKRLMQMGYSLSYANGKLIRNSEDVIPGSVVVTQLVDGQFTSEVKEVK